MVRPTRLRRERRQIRRMAELFIAGHPVEGIARITGASTETVERVLERVGLTPQKTNERRSSR